MILPIEFYDNPTDEQIEENIEFIDWTIVPINLITQDIKDKFSDFRELQLIIWLQDILDTCEVMKNNSEFPNAIFFFRDRNCLIEFYKGEIMQISYEEIITAIVLKFNLELLGTAFPIISNVAKYHFGKENIKVTALFDDRRNRINYLFDPKH